jgi:prepilin-type N-terminal cleavage/methylation domain-containing protein
VTAVRHREDGFSLIELLVAIAIIAVGVLGTFALIQVATAQTSQTKQREAATNLVREISDAAQGMPFTAVTPTSIQSELQSRGFADDKPTVTGWQVVRRGATFTVDASACVVDDPSDGSGTHPVADGYCADSPTGTTDGSAKDYKRIVVQITPPSGKVVRQTAIVGATRASVAGSGGGSGGSGGGGSGGSGTGSVSDLIITAPATRPFGQIAPTCWATCTPSVSPSPYSQTPIQVSFQATTASNVDKLKWFVDGTLEETDTGPGTTFTFTWGLDQHEPDGVYQVAAQPFDSAGTTSTGSMRTIDVTLNRFRPDATAFVPALAGRNPLFNNVPEVETYPASNTVRVDRDIVQFEAWRYPRNQAGVAACVAPGTTRWCADPGYPTSTTQMTYALFPYDKAPDGTLRYAANFSGMSRDVMSANTRPNPPTALTATKSGDTVTLSWTNPAGSGDPNSGDCIDTYRIYRRAADSTTWTYADRYDRTPFGNVATQCGTVASSSFTDEDAATSHAYRVTAVDTRLAESTMTSTVIR